MWQRDYVIKFSIVGYKQKEKQGYSIIFLSLFNLLMLMLLTNLNNLDPAFEKPTNYCRCNWREKNLSVPDRAGHKLSGELMAQFTAGVRLKPFVTGNGFSVGFGSFHRRCRVKCIGGRSGGCFSCWLLGDRKRKLCVSTAHASKSSSQSSSAASNAGGMFDELLEDEAGFEIDELAGFRGLVLDISYRSACNFKIHTHTHALRIFSF